MNKFLILKERTVQNAKILTVGAMESSHEINDTLQQQQTEWQKWQKEALKLTYPWTKT